MRRSVATSSVTSARRSSPEVRASSSSSSMAARSSDSISSSLAPISAMRPSGSPSASMLGPAAAQLLEQVAQPGNLLPVGRAHARTQQAAQGVVEVAAGQQVVGQAGQQVVGSRSVNSWVPSHPE